MKELPSDIILIKYCIKKKKRKSFSTQVIKDKTSKQALTVIQTLQSLYVLTLVLPLIQMDMLFYFVCWRSEFAFMAQ